MTRYAIFDVESNGLLPRLHTIHLVVVKDIQTNEVFGFRDPHDAVKYLDTFDRVIGHNCIQFDLPALKKITGWVPKARPIDTCTLSRLLWPDRNTHPAGGSSLKNWGLYLKMPKGDFKDFSAWSPEMETYCIQDVQITHLIYNHIMPAAHKCAYASTLELDTASIIAEQIANGFGFNYRDATLLLADLTSKQAKVTAVLQQVFPPKEIQLKTKVKYVPFNPGSRDMIAVAFMKKYGWKPTELTETGKPQIDESILSGLKYPEAEILNEYLMLEKRIGQLNQWLAASKSDKIHGDVNTNGAVSGRMTHSNPNIAQVPRCGSPYGAECRALFGPTRKGWLQVGADAAGLELRMFAHYLAEYDGGDYGNVICEGDIHSHNQAMAGLKTRDQAKTFIYGLLYGAGDEKVGKIVEGSRADGHRLKEAFKKQVPAYVKLLNKLEYETARSRLLTGLDGRPLPVRSAYSALNLLLQSAGAVVMKKALIIMAKKMNDKYQGKFAFMANVHDEVQIECDPTIAQDCGKIMTDSITQAGLALELKCPLSGNFKVGNNWGDTH